MSRRTLRAAALLALAGLATLGGAQEPAEVAVTLDPPALTVGDRVSATLELVVEGDGADAAFPDWSRGWGEAEILEVGEIERTRLGGGTRLRQRLQITAFRPGDLPLPPVAVRRGAEGPEIAATPPGLALEVRSVLPAGEAEVAPLPAEPPRPLALPLTAYGAIGGLVAAILAAALWARHRDRASVVAELPAPHAELLAALEALTHAEPEPGHGTLSHALRRYLGRALEFPAVESSTREIERALASRRLEPALVRDAARLLRESDLVKFGRRPAGRADLAQRAAAARAIGDAVEAHLRPIAEPEESAA